MGIYFQASPKQSGASNKTVCDLCGLSLRHSSIQSEFHGKSYAFCCMGCRQVFSMLVETTDATDPQEFKKTDLYKKCLEMGILPASEADLENRVKQAVISDPTFSLPQDDRSMPQKNQGSVKDTTLRLTLFISGMWCPACSWVIEEGLKKGAGIMDPVCNFSTDRLICKYDPTVTSPTRIMDVIKAMGYQAHLPEESLQKKVVRNEFIRFSICAFLTINVMMLSFALYTGFFMVLPQDEVYKISWPILIMASCVLFYGGAKIFQKAWSGITSAAYSMETLVSVGALSAYLYSCYNFMMGSIHQYFDTASMLITLVLLGKLLEGRAKNKIQEDLDGFFFLAPRKVRICTASFPEGRYVDIDQLERNHIFQVVENEIVPADGVIVEGKGTADESSLTGEALPVLKKPGERLRSGTRVLEGIFRVRAEKVGRDTILGQMIQIMEDALEQKTPVEGSTDLILRWFVPTIILLAMASGILSVFLGNSQEVSVMRAITVLVIACPCALGIAIPLARVAGVSLAGKMGILVRNFAAFSRSKDINTFVFDKTGTVTRGNWTLFKVLPFEKFTDVQVLSLAVALERDSDHYIAMEIKRMAKGKSLASTEMDRITCYENGVSGWSGKKEIKIGSKKFLQNEIKASTPELFRDNLQFDPAVSTVYMSFDGKLCAAFLFGDKIRQNAFTTLKALRDLGYGLALVSGDGDETTKVVGQKLGIQDSYGGKLPQDKALFIENMQRESGSVSMVGDGVNDAPALAKAALSFAVYSGSNLGKEAADITLMRGDVGQVLDFLTLSRHVNRKISQNLLFSFLYNTLSIPVAMAGLLTPLIAVCAMLMSSLTVIGNTLLLTKYKKFHML